MSVLKDIKNIAILILLAVVIVSQFKGCTPSWPWGDSKSDTTVVVDTTYVKVKEEVPVYVPKWRTKLKTDTLEIEKIKDVDTAAILADYYSKYQYIDTLKLSYTDSLGKKLTFGTGVVTDTISRNTITGRSIIWNYQIPYITKTITIYPPARRQLYVGAGTAFNRTNFVDNVSGGLIYKNKEDKIYQFSLGLGNHGGGVSPFVGAGIYWKIKLKK
jgi:hypothetical protein